MTMAGNEDDTRKVETEITIAATREQVWEALTDPDELVRWFPLEAKVNPGPGGRIYISWGCNLDGNCRIEYWEPGRRLVTTWFEPAGARQPRPLVVEYTLESVGGKTTLRLVHSGFGTGADWDDEYHGVRRGWNFELRSLRHYLERHRGKNRHVAWARAAVDLPAEQAWRRLWSADALLKEGAIPRAPEGQPYAIAFATGDRLEGSTLVLEQPTDFAGTVENLNGSLFRLGYETFSGRTEIFLWLSAWELPREQVKAIEGAWRGMLERVLVSAAS